MTTSAFNPAFNIAFRAPHPKAEYVKIDEERFRDRVGPFTKHFDLAFDKGSWVRPWGKEFDTAFGPRTQWETLRFWGWMDDHPRPKHPLWRRYRYPMTPMGIFLWRDGRVVVTESFYSDDWLSADVGIMGGHEWFAEKTSWTAQVLEAAGFPLIPHYPMWVYEFPLEGRIGG